MKNIGVIILTSIISSFAAIALYSYFYGQPVEAEPIIIKSSEPSVIYTNYADDQAAEEKEEVAEKKQSNYAYSDFTEGAAIATPGVVNIKSTTGGDYDFWGGGGSGSGSSGSGVIISPDGYIITNNHVIEDGTSLEVTLYDKRKFEAKLIGVDPSTDLALIKVKSKDLPYLSFGNSDAVQVGEWVLAVGNPFNLESTVTAGIVSAKGRSIDILDDQYRIESFIQTDAAVNPGNSGGALINPSGELVGINTAIITRSGRYEGYSFAIPSNLAKKVIRDLKDFGVVQRGILGVSIEEVDSERANALDLKKVAGVYLTAINGGSGAEEAGLERGDVILSINGTMTNTIPELQELVARFRPGDRIKVDFYREGKRYNTEVELKTKDQKTTVVTKVDDSLLKDLGFELRNLTRSEKQKLQVEGVYVKSVYRGSSIERTNMDPGFIIIKVNKKKVTSIADVIAAVQEADDEVQLDGIYEDYPGEYGYKFPLSR